MVGLVFNIDVSGELYFIVALEWHTYGKVYSRINTLPGNVFYVQLISSSVWTLCSRSRYKCLNLFLIYLDSESLLFTIVMILSLLLCMCQKFGHNVLHTIYIGNKILVTKMKM